MVADACSRGVVIFDVYIFAFVHLSIIISERLSVVCVWHICYHITVYLLPMLFVILALSITSSCAFVSRLAPKCLCVAFARIVM